MTDIEILVVFNIYLEKQSKEVNININKDKENTKMILARIKGEGCEKYRDKLVKDIGRRWRNRIRD